MIISFALAHFARRRVRRIRFVRVLRSTGIAVHSGRLVPDHSFDSMSQNELAFATPAVDGPARSRIAFSFHKSPSGENSASVRLSDEFLLFLL